MNSLVGEGRGSDYLPSFFPLEKDSKPPRPFRVNYKCMEEKDFKNLVK
jgi:hypothetical protein